MNKKHSVRVKRYSNSLKKNPNIEDKEYYIGLKEKRLKVIKPLDVRHDGVTFGFIKEQNKKLNRKITELQKELQLYKNGGIILKEEGNYIKEIINIPSNEFILTSKDFSNDITNDILKLVNTTLYGRIPFLKRENNIVVIDKIQYNKYKGVL